MKKAATQEDIQALLDKFAFVPSFLKYAETAKTKDAKVDGKKILEHADLARALCGAEKLNRSVIQAYLNTHQI